MTESECLVKCEATDVVQCEELTAEEEADIKPLLQPDGTVDSVLKDGWLPRQRRPKLYYCQECDEAFSTAYWLKEHVALHDDIYAATSDDRYVCRMCAKAFTSARKLQDHMKHHFVEKPYHCQDCDQKFINARGLLYHTKLHSIPSSHFKHLECKICDRTFVYPKYFEMHMKSHSMPQEQRKLCRHCGTYFRNSPALKQHKLLMHSTTAQRCKLCGKMFVHPSHLKLHMRLHTDDKPYECTHCGEKFAWMSGLRSHELMHPEVMRTRMFICDLCGRDFQSHWSLRRHERWHREKPDGCEICGLTCSTTIELKRHRLVHLTDREFKCDICKMRFTTPSNLEIHMLSHFRKFSSQLFTPAAPIVRKQSYQCNQCDRIFCNPTSMRRHAVAHACNKHRCELCGRSYLNILSLNVHRSKTRHFVPNPQIHIGTSRRGPVSAVLEQQPEKRSILLTTPVASRSILSFEGWKKRSERTTNDAPEKQQFEGWKRRADRTVDNNTSTPTVDPAEDKSLLDIPPIVIAPQSEETSTEQNDAERILIEPDDIKEEPA